MTGPIAAIPSVVKKARLDGHGKMHLRKVGGLSCQIRFSDGFSTGSLINRINRMLRRLITISRQPFTNGGRLRSPVPGMTPCRNATVAGLSRSEASKHADNRQA